jgi:photosystem II stability/assembly factor-like uncharacterized protein
MKRSRILTPLGVVIIGGLAMMALPAPGAVGRASRADTSQLGTGWRRTGGAAGGAALSLAIDSRRPAILYRGGDEGVAKSTDGGRSWQDASNGLPDLDILAIAIDATKSDTLYAGTSDCLCPHGVYRSTDGARSWIRKSDGLPSDVDVVSLVIDPMAPLTIYAGMGGVYKSIDGGTNWIRSSDGLPIAGVGGLALSPSDALTLYVSLDGPSGGEGVYKSTDGAVTWAVASSEEFSDNAIPSLAVDPSDSSLVYAATADTEGTGDGGVFKTTDGGDHWTRLTKGRNANAIAIDFSLPRCGVRRD